VKPLLELRGVGKGYAGRAEPVLSGVDLDVRAGEFVAVVGCSGSGKTTLVSMAAGLLEPDGGEVVFDGERSAPPGPERAVVFQSYALLPWLTVLGNVLLGVDAASPGLDHRAAVDKARTFVDLVRLGPAERKRPAELSGGMRQRVALARALAMEPRLLLLDEPLSALDALTRAALQDELARVRQATQSTVVLVTNDVDEAILLADRVVPLTKGPAATLGESIAIGVPRPRVRAHMSLAPGYQHAKREIVAALTGDARGRDGARSAVKRTSDREMGSDPFFDGELPERRVAVGGGRP
jgi:nitrate/nitrite transport system ATP-binding protein